MLFSWYFHEPVLILKFAAYCSKVKAEYEKCLIAAAEDIL